MCLRTRRRRQHEMQLLVYLYIKSGVLSHGKATEILGLRINKLIRFNMINANCQALGQPLQYNEAAIKEYEDKKVDVKPKQDKIAMVLTEISSYPLNEIQQLNYLVREYIVVKQQNASKNCFINKREKE